jgi:hypothetical protein
LLQKMTQLRSTLFLGSIVQKATDEVSGTVETRLIAEMTLSRAASTLLLRTLSRELTKMLNVPQINSCVSDF